MSENTPETMPEQGENRGDLPHFTDTLKKQRFTEREARFIESYLSCYVGAQAAREAGYSVRTARSIAHELMNKPKIRAVIDEGLRAQGLHDEQWET